MNMQAMLKQAKKMQQEMSDEKSKLDNELFVEENDLIKVEIMGSKKIKKITIKNKENMDEEDLEMLEDMLLVNMNNLFSKIDKETKKRMGKFGAGMSGLF